jgi:hypothetical protein
VTGRLAAAALDNAAAGCVINVSIFVNATAFTGAGSLIRLRLLVTVLLNATPIQAHQ